MFCDASYFLYAASYAEDSSCVVWNKEHTKICPEPSSAAVNEYFDWWQENQKKYGEMDKAIKKFKKHKLKREKCARKHDIFKLMEDELKKQQRRRMKGKDLDGKSMADDD